MTVVARRIRSTPHRTGIETWHYIVNLIAARSNSARLDLLAVEGVAASVIADETPGWAPIVVSGSGPRLRVYCLYGDDAVSGDGAAEEALSWDPTENDWQVSLPVADEELAWITASLKKIGTRVVAYDPDAETRASTSSAQRDSDFQVDVEAFKRS